jgi:hypothetical protein
MKKILTDPKYIFTGEKDAFDVEKSFSVPIRTFFPRVSLF